MLRAEQEQGLFTLEHPFRHLPLKGTNAQHLYNYICLYHDDATNTVAVQPMISKGIEMELGCCNVAMVTRQIGNAAAGIES